MILKTPWYLKTVSIGEKIWTQMIYQGLIDQRVYNNIKLAIIEQLNDTRFPNSQLEILQKK